MNVNIVSPSCRLEYGEDAAVDSLENPEAEITDCRKDNYRADDLHGEWRGKNPKYGSNTPDEQSDPDY